MSLLTEVEEKRKRVHTDSYSATWRELLSQHKDREIDIDPDFQRLFRWDYDLQTKFIESLILDIPVPPIFLYRNDDAVLEVIDGLQRLSTLLKFFAPERNASPIEPSQAKAAENDIKIPTILTEGSLLKSLKGHSYESLPDKLLRTIKGARVNVILLEQDSSKETKYEVFKRLNKYGVKLSAQEIRNVTGRLYGKDFPVALKSIAADTTIRSTLSLKESRQQKMDVEELVLRFLAFSYGIDLFVHKMDDFLDDFMIHASDGKFRLTPDVKKNVVKTFALIGKALPDGGAFKFYKDGTFKGGFSTTLYDIVVPGVYSNVDKLKPATIKQKVTALHSSSEMRALVGAGSNTKKKIIGRVMLGHKWFQ